MAFWSRIRQSKIKALVSLQCEARLFGSPNNGSPLTYASKTLAPCLGENPIRGFIGKPSAFSDGFRFFASSAQAEKGAVLNEKIEFPIVRLVTDDGRHFTLSSSVALEQAKRLNLDLVLVQSDADPPVCKIFDYRKERYKKKAMEKERNKSKEKLQSDLKEVRFSAKTEQRDLKMKAATIKRLMEDGYRVKCVATPSKNRRTASGDGEDEERKELETLFASLIKMIADEAIVECEPVVKNGQAHIIVRHIKFGPSKKGGAKKLKDVDEDTPEDRTFSKGDDQPAGSLEDDWRGQQSQPIQPELPPPFPPQGSSSPTPGYGVFSPPSASIPGVQGVAAESNRYARKPNVPSFGPPSLSIPGGQGVAAESNRYARKPNAPSSNPEGRRPGLGHSEQGAAFGRFSRDGPRFNQSNVPKTG